MAFGGVALKLLQITLYLITFGCSAIVLAIYSYFLAVQASNDVDIPNQQRAITGIAGVGALYSAVAFIFTCCLGGIIFFAFVGMVFNLALAGAFLAVAILTKGAANGCSGAIVSSPLGSGLGDARSGRGGRQFAPSNSTACRMNQVVFAVAIIGTVVFFISIFSQLWLGKHHQKQKRYGPSPANGYTSGNGIRFFKRRRGEKSAHAVAAKEAEAGYGPSAVPYESTGTFVGNKYEPTELQQTGTLGTTSAYPTTGYHAGPTGSGVNPYGYDNSTGQQRTGANF